LNGTRRAGAGIAILAMVASLMVATAAPAESAVEGCVAAPSGLVAWWPGDGDVLDYEDANDGMLVGGAGFTGSGKVGQAFGFDGVDDYVEVADSDLWNFGSGDFTIEMWVNHSSLPPFDPGSPPVLIGNDEGSGDNNKWFIGSGDVLTFHINGPTSDSHFLVNSPFTPSLGVWNHVAVTRSENTFSVYIDGALAGTEDSSVTIPDAAAALTIGQAEGLFTHGLIDEVSIYDQALDVAEIAAIHNAGSAGKCKGFADTIGNTFEVDIEWLADQGITKGCNPPDNTLYCPDDFVSRGQMAAFMVRALDYTDDGGGDLFTDDDGNTFEADIDKLASAGVTKGCNPPTNDEYCPNDFVTRGQMAAFLVRAMGYTDDGGGDLFTDDDGNTFQADIDKLGTAGVTKGCNPPTNTEYCPNDFVTRGQMAAFLRRALEN
jgi:hypothetical protein